MDFIKNVIDNPLTKRIFWSIIVVIFSLLIYHVIARVLNAREKRVTKIMNNKKNKTVIHMLKSIVAGSLSIITVLMVLQIYGINVSSMLAGVGIASVVIGFALQDSLKDIIRGFVIISDDYYEIGDVIHPRALRHHLVCAVSCFRADNHPAGQAPGTFSHIDRPQ